MRKKVKMRLRCRANMWRRFFFVNAHAFLHQIDPRHLTVSHPNRYCASLLLFKCCFAPISSQLYFFIIFTQIYTVDFWCCCIAKRRTNTR